jgi:hypothetical protein
MSLTFEAEPDKRLLSAAVRHVSRERFAVLRALGVAAGAVGVIGWLAAEAGAVYLLGCLAVALFFGVALVELVARQAVRMGVQRVGRPTTYRFASDAVGISTELMRMEMSWAAIRTSEELSGQVILGLLGGGFVTVPVGGLTADQLTGLRELLGEHVAKPVTAGPPPAPGPAAAKTEPPGVRPPAP